MRRPGDPRVPGSGRKPGTPNRKTQDLMKRCEEMGIDPFEVLLEMTKSDDPMIKLSAAKEACRYVYPTRKSIDIDSTVMGAAATQFAFVSNEELVRLAMGAPRVAGQAPNPRPDKKEVLPDDKDED